MPFARIGAGKCVVANVGRIADHSVKLALWSGVEEVAGD